MYSFHFWSIFGKVFHFKTEFAKPAKLGPTGTKMWVSKSYSGRHTKMRFCDTVLNLHGRSISNLATRGCFIESPLQG